MGYIMDLYGNGFHPSEDDRPSGTEYTAALKRANDCTNKILARLDEDGKKLFEQFLSAKADIISFEMSKAFEQGVIFGGNVILEICQN